MNSCKSSAEIWRNKKRMIKKPLPQDELADGYVSIVETYVCRWRAAASLMEGASPRSGGRLSCLRLSLCLSLFREKHSLYHWTTKTWSRVVSKSGEWNNIVECVKWKRVFKLKTSRLSSGTLLLQSLQLLSFVRFINRIYIWHTARVSALRLRTLREM
jgi:hypothetical protein